MLHGSLPCECVYLAGCIFGRANRVKYITFVLFARNVLLHHRCIQNPAILAEISRMLNLNVSESPVSEDCLYLNVYTPSDRSAEERLPVRSDRTHSEQCLRASDTHDKRDYYRESSGSCAIVLQVLRVLLITGETYSP